MLGCGAAERLLAIPREELQAWTSKMHVSAGPNGHRHIRITNDADRYVLRLKGRGNKVDITRFLV